MKEIKLTPNTGSTLLIIGPSKKGKTHLVKELYNKYFTKYISSLFTDSYNVYENSFPKDVVIFKCFEPDIISMAKEINDGTKNHYNFLFILDDLIEIKGEKRLINMFLTYRNSNISTIVSIQDDKLVDIKVRSNANHIFIFQPNTDLAAEKIIKTYLLGFMSNGVFGDFLKEFGMPERIFWLRNILEDHRFIHIDVLNNYVELGKV
jgi:GTPase SAR1 family protein